jgi:carboxymethylenebutenolidase
MMTPADGAGPSQSRPAPTGSLVNYPGPGEGYLALPSGSGHFPGVVVIQEWWGLDPHIKSVVDRFAGEGFAALAPDLYHGRVVTEPDEARKLAMGLQQKATIQEIQNAVDFLAGRPDVSPARVAVVGFCMGGGLALQMAVKGERVGVVAPFYGRPLSPEEAALVKVPVVGSYGEDDHSIPLDAVQAMVDQIRAAGKPVDIKVYPAGHAFFNDTRQSYDPHSAADAWQRVLAAFRRQLNVS